MQDRRSRWWCGALGLSACLILPSYGQMFGDITGLVTDSSRAVLVGATVTVTNTQANATRSADTNNLGNYSFPALLPSIYSVKVEMAGMQTKVHNGVELQVQQVPRIDFQLKVGYGTTTLEVTSGAPLPTTKKMPIGIVINNMLSFVLSVLWGVR